MSKILSFAISLLILLFIFAEFLHPITSTNPDIWLHLLTGKLILATRHVPRTNLFSYTYSAFPFINSHWLSEVIFYGIFHFFKFPGLIFFSGIIGVATYILLFSSVRRSISLVTFLFVSIVTTLVVFERTDVRPELFSYLFLAIFVSILYRYKQRFTSLIFLLIPFELLWVNLHIYFILGIGALCFFLLDEFIYICQKKQWKNTKKLQILFLVTFIASLITLLNPNGLRGALFPMTFTNNYGFSVGENANLFFLQQRFSLPTVAAFEFAVIVVLSTLVINRKQTAVVDWLLWLSFSMLGFIAIRNIPLFVIACFIPFVRYIELTLQKVKTFFHSYPFLIFSLTFLFLFLLLSEIGILIPQKGLGVGREENNKRAIDYFIQQHLKGNIYNNFAIGSYLDYRLYPKNVFVDNRPEAYPASFFQKTYLPMQTDKATFTKAEKIYHFNFIILAKQMPSIQDIQFLQWIRKDTQWYTSYEDSYTIILDRAK